MFHVKHFIKLCETEKNVLTLQNYLETIKKCKIIAEKIPKSL